MNLGGNEILVIIVIAIFIFGPDKLPSVLKTVGKVTGELKKYQDIAKSEIDNAMASVDIKNDESNDLNPETKPSEAETQIPKSDSTKQNHVPVPPILDEEFDG